MKTVLIADDEKNVRVALATAFRLEGYRTETASDGREALEAIARGGIDLVVLDLQMPSLDGLEVLRTMRREGHVEPVMILTAHGSIETAIEATRLGAFDFLEKPPHAEKILLTARNALRQAALEQENRELRGEDGGSDEIVGSSPPMRRLLEEIRRVAAAEARVLITGENGTGKELVARAIHRLSSRAEGPFVAVNCSAIPRDLFESELFGHERGAFTGATARRRGKFLRASGGTLFLDEVGEIPLELQPKLLRSLETGVIEPVGAERETTVDVRVVAATNRDLDAAVRGGAFRQDLFYRLQVVRIHVPPLRERLEDVPDLARRFLVEACAENKIGPKRLTEDAVASLSTHDWPGNVRELRNVVERLVILTPGEEIDARAVAGAMPTGGPPIDGPRGGTLREILEATERDVILRAVERHGWRMASAARALGLERSHLYKKLKAHGIEKP